VDNHGSSTIFFYGGKAPTGIQITGFELTNNLLRAVSWAVFGEMAGEAPSAFNMYTPSPVIQHNTFAGSQAKLYPVGNDFPTVAAWADRLRGAAARNYQLQTDEPVDRAGTDGKSLGVDFNELNAAMNATAAPPPPPPPHRPPAAAPPPSGGSTPYSGTAVNLPARWSSRTYDAGGHDIAYYDTTVRQHRRGVSLERRSTIAAASDTGGGYWSAWAVAANG
jgi:hypothetical protein